MSGDRFKIQDQQGLYFLTPTVVQWIDACLSARLPARQGRQVFTRTEYRDIVVNSLNHCIQNKGFVVNSWVIMSNHLHLVARVNEPDKLSDFLRDFKKFTSKAILRAIVDNPESRR